MDTDTRAECSTLSPAPKTDHEYLILISSQMNDLSNDTSVIIKKVTGPNGLCSQIQNHEMRITNIESDVVTIQHDVKKFSGWQTGVMAIFAFLTLILVAAGRYLDLFFG